MGVDRVQVHGDPHCSTAGAGGVLLPAAGPLAPRWFPEIAHSSESRQHAVCPSRVTGLRADGLARGFSVICISEARDCFSVGVNMGPGDGVLKPKGKVRAGH